MRLFPYFLAAALAWPLVPATQAAQSCAMGVLDPDLKTLTQYANYSDADLKNKCRAALHIEAKARDKKESDCLSSYKGMRETGQKMVATNNRLCKTLDSLSSCEGQQNCAQNVSELNASAAADTQAMVDLMGTAVDQSGANSRVMKGYQHEMKTDENAMLSMEGDELKRPKAPKRGKAETKPVVHAESSGQGPRKPGISKGTSSKPAPDAGDAPNISYSTDDKPEGSVPASRSGSGGNTGAAETGAGNAGVANSGGNSGGGGIDIDAPARGYQNIGEYRANVSRLIREQELAIEESEKFQRAAEKSKEKYESKTATFLKMAATAAQAAALLSPVGEEGRDSSPVYDPVYEQKKEQPRSAEAAKIDGSLSTEKLVLPASPFLGSPTLASAETGAEEKQDPAESEGFEAFAGNLTMEKSDDLEEKKGLPAKEKLHASLRDILRAKLKVGKNGEILPADGAGEKVSVTEASLAEGGERGLASVDRSGSGSRAYQSGGTVDEAVADMQRQMDAVQGILESESKDLFVRVKDTHVRSLKRGIIRATVARRG